MKYTSDIVSKQTIFIWITKQISGKEEGKVLHGAEDMARDQSRACHPLVRKRMSIFPFRFFILVDHTVFAAEPGIDNQKLEFILEHLTTRVLPIVCNQSSHSINPSLENRRQFISQDSLQNILNAF
jgi:hypothetical protein